MKIGLYTDPHLSQTSSIIVGKSGDFSGRLTNLIESFEWMNEFFKGHDCQEIFCLGDMTDKPNLTAEEITALSLCHVEDHHLIVGNHCRSDKDGRINSLSMLKHIYYEPQILDYDGFKILILPFNSTPYNLDDYGHVDLILSHNDLKGYDFGRGHVSEVGYEMEDILNHCDLFINGHLHNGAWLVQDRVINLGQVSGMNFSSCNGQWEPSVGVFDTETRKLELFENPKGYRFKKLEFKTLASLKSYLDNLPCIGRYVLQVKILGDFAGNARKLLDQCDKVAASRILTVSTKEGSRPSKNLKDEVKIDDGSVYDKLREFVKIQNPSKYSIDKLNEIINKMERKEGSD